MNPQLPKVETGPLSEEIKNGLEKAYGGDPTAVDKPVVNPSEVLRASGSVGVEAGLTDFEVVSEDNAQDDGSSDDDDDSSSSTDAQSTPVKAVVGSVAVAQTPVAAEDKDDIEKEWISKAKRIVEQTKSDPFLQERAVSRLQADYLKKRFNKDIKLSEGDT